LCSAAAGLFRPVDVKTMASMSWRRGTGPVEAWVDENVEVGPFSIYSPPDAGGKSFIYDSSTTPYKGIQFPVKLKDLEETCYGYSPFTSHRYTSCIPSPL
jgi:hypothetical protein